MIAMIVDATKSPEGQILFVDADHCIAVWHNVFIVIWRKETTMFAVRSLTTHLASLTGSEAVGFALLTIIEAGAPMPSPDVRTALAQFMTTAKGRLKSSAVAFEGAGFRAAAVRGVVTGLTMLARQPYPHKVFASVADAAGWLGTTMRVTAHAELDATSLTNAIAALRERIGRS